MSYSFVFCVYYQTMHVVAHSFYIFDIFFQQNKATVFIEERKMMADVTFPARPTVMSLRDYDQLNQFDDELPIQGYPVVCVTVRQCENN